MLYCLFSFFVVKNLMYNNKKRFLTLYAVKCVSLLLGLVKIWYIQIQYSTFEPKYGNIELIYLIIIKFTLKLIIISLVFCLVIML